MVRKDFIESGLCLNRLEASETKVVALESELQISRSEIEQLQRGG